MNILESLITTGNIAASGYLASSGDATLATYSGAIGAGLIIVEGTINYFEGRTQTKRDKIQQNWDEELIRLKAGY